VIETIRQGLQAEGITVSISELCRWFGDERAGAPHALHLLDVPDEVCKARLRARNAAGDHPFETSDAEFDQISRHFVAPTADEGFDVIRHN